MRLCMFIVKQISLWLAFQLGVHFRLCFSFPEYVSDTQAFNNNFDYQQYLFINNYWILIMLNIYTPVMYNIITCKYL